VCFSFPFFPFSHGLLPAFFRAVVGRSVTLEDTFLIQGLFSFGRTTAPLFFGISAFLLEEVLFFPCKKKDRLFPLMFSFFFPLVR